MANVTQGVPAPASPLIRPDNSPDPIWYKFFVNLWQRTGAAGGTLSAILDNISNVAGALLYRSPTVWTGLNPGTENQLLRMNGGFPNWADIDAASFSNESANTLLAGPASGATAPPTFRALATADLNSVAGQIPGTATNDNATAGNVGEYISAQVLSGAAIALSSNVVANITSVTLTPGDWDVWGLVATLPAALSVISHVAGWLNTVSAADPGAPNNGAYFHFHPVTTTSGLELIAPVGTTRISVAVNTTVYVSMVSVFGGTVSGYGFIGARRVR